MRSEEIEGKPFEHWTPQEVHDAFQAGEVVIIDVRTPQEYMFQRIEGALLAPMGDLNPRYLPTQEGKRIVLQCGSGVRSQRVGAACLKAGMEVMAHLEGGFRAWKKAGLPFLGTDKSTGAPVRMTRATAED